MAHHPLPKGLRLGHFRIVDTLGVGECGVTYLGVNLSKGAKVVLKENLPMMLATREKQRFQVFPFEKRLENLYYHSIQNFTYEARMMARIKHRSIVGVKDVFKANGTAYFTMPFIHGQSLRDWIQLYRTSNTRFPEYAIRQGLIDLLDGIEKIHQAKRLHLGIRPENILIDPQTYRPTLIDFEHHNRRLNELYEKYVGPDSVLMNHYGAFEEYMADRGPEPASDIYRLALAAFATITLGKVKPVVDRLLAVSSNQRDPIVELLDQIRRQGYYSSKLLLAIEAGVEIEPQNRPRSAAEFKQALL